MDFRFSLKLTVRDYVCDFQGIVNNAVYLNYLEHARHVFAKSVSLDVVELATRGINVVLVRSEIEYRASLRIGDSFAVALDVERLSRLKFPFDQRIYRIPAECTEESHIEIRSNLILKARMTATALNVRGRPFQPPELDVLFRKEPMSPD